jgi:hypothetical protein
VQADAAIGQPFRHRAADARLEFAAHIHLMVAHIKAALSVGQRDEVAKSRYEL